MALLGKVIKRTIELRGKMPAKKSHPIQHQTKVLKSLIKKAQFTAFGQHYKFSNLLKEDDLVRVFAENVPIHDYNSMFRNWWYRALNGEPYVSWPGAINYFALSSGTSEAASKHIPVTKEMLKAIRKGSIRQILSMAHLNLPEEHFQKGILLIGGSTHLNYNGTYHEGDVSGITAGSIPFWFQFFYKPGPRISRYTDWSTKLEEITSNAKNWDIGIICGVPAWVQILIEKVIKKYNVKHIHEIWPNLRIFVSGGVAVSPYINAFEKLTKFPLIFCDTYLASEGFIAYQITPIAGGPLKMLTDNGIYFEFIPFTEENFDTNGDLRSGAKALPIDQTSEGTEYAIMLTTCSGAWRYLIGDVIKFTSVENAEIVITGRTKHFLSLCGEHLSVDNMTRAFHLAAEEMNLDIQEFCVCGVRYESLFAHQWYIGSDVQFDEKTMKEKIDSHLKILNDDYRVERTSALREVLVTQIPTKLFVEFLHHKGKVTAQTKFPRVLNGKTLSEWKSFIEGHGFSAEHLESVNIK